MKEPVKNQIQFLNFQKILCIMEAPKLETVPEETEAQPVSRPTNKHITSDVTKTAPHPGRVASGRRLAERNRLAREAKKQSKAASAAPNPDTNPEPTPTTSSSSDSSSNTSGYLILGVGGLLVSAMGVYYQREAIMKTLGRNTPASAAPPTPPTPKGEEFKDLPTAIHRSLRPAPKRRSGIREME